MAGPSGVRRLAPPARAVVLAAAAATMLFAAVGPPGAPGQLQRAAGALAGRQVGDRDLKALLDALAWVTWLAATSALALATARAGRSQPGPAAIVVNGQVSATMAAASIAPHDRPPSTPRRRGASLADLSEHLAAREPLANMSPTIAGAPARPPSDADRASSAASPKQAAPTSSKTSAAGEPARPAAPGGRVSVAALSALLRVQRRLVHLQRVEDAAETANGRGDEPADDPAGDALKPTDESPAQSGRAHRVDAPSAATPPASDASARRHLPVRLEEPDWARAAVGMVADLVSPSSGGAGCRALLLEAETITCYLEAPSDSGAGRRPDDPERRAWVLRRDAREMAAVPVSPTMLAASRRAGLVSAAATPRARLLVDLVAAGTTVLEGPSAALGGRIAELALDLALRRWSDLDRLLLVGFGAEMHGLEGVRHAPDMASAHGEVAAARDEDGALVVLVPPWAAGDAGDLELLRRRVEASDDIGLLAAVDLGRPGLRWRVGGGQRGGDHLEFADALRFTSGPLADEGEGGALSGATSLAVRTPDGATSKTEGVVASDAPARRRPAARLSDTVEVRVLGQPEIAGAAPGLERRPRLSELVVYLALHPNGSTSEAFATALWPDRRVPLQTLSNRLSEARALLGDAPDGRPRLRKHNGRHLLADTTTDWDQFRELASEGGGADSWRRALELVRGRPFQGLSRSEWVHLDGFATAIDAAVVGVACRLGEYSLARHRAEVAKWAAHQGLLASPWDERLYRLWMRAEDAGGSRAGVEAVLRALATALELEGDPLSLVHPETAALYARLTASDGRR